MMELKCQNCGGQLKFDESDVRVNGGWVIWRSRETLTCGSCGTQFVWGDDLSEDKGSLGDTISVENVSNSSGAVAIGRGAVAAGKGGIAIGGSASGVIITGSSNIVVGGDITGGDSVTIINDRQVRKYRSY